MPLEQKLTMDNFWEEYAKSYGNANDLEEKIRNRVGFFLEKLIANHKDGGVSILELACGNGKILHKIARFLRSEDKLVGVDSSAGMITEARKLLSDNICELHNEGMMDFLSNQAKKYDAIVCCNSLHNLESRFHIENAILCMCEKVALGGKIIFDIRNTFNPFVYCGYRKNRLKGLFFHTFSFLKAKKILKSADFKIITCEPIYYLNLEEAGKADGSFFIKIIRRLYLFITSFKIFSQYILICAEKK